MRQVVWDYGALSEEQEADYIKAKLEMLFGDNPGMLGLMTQGLDRMVVWRPACFFLGERGGGVRG